MDKLGWTFRIEIKYKDCDTANYITHNLKRMHSFMESINYDAYVEVHVYSYYGVILK
jgi:hypothetical protein